MFMRIDHVEIVPSNLDRTVKFYTDILGFKLKLRQRIDAPPLEEAVFLELNDTVIELLRVKNPASVPPDIFQTGYRLIAIQVADMDKSIEYLKKKGVDIAWGPVAIGESKRAEIRDPDGYPIELRQWPKGKVI